MSQEFTPPADELRAKPSVSRYAWVILGVSLIAYMAATQVQFKVVPVMPDLIQAFKLDMASAGLLMSLFSVTGLILALPAGLVLQKLGVKYAMMSALCCLLIGTIMGYISSDVGLMWASRLVEGVGVGLLLVACPAIIGMWFPPQAMGLPMGLYGACFPLAAMAVINVGANISGSLGWRSVWVYSGGFTVLAFVLVMAFIRMPQAIAEAKSHSGGPPSGDAVNFKTALSNRSIWLLTVVFGITVMVMINLVTFFPTYLSTALGYSMNDASLISSFMFFAMIIGGPLGGMLSDKIGSRKMLFSWPFIIIAILMAFLFSVSGILIPIWMIILGALIAMISAVVYSAVPEIMEKPQFIGLGMAALAIGTNVGGIVGPIFFGSLIDKYSWQFAGYALIPMIILAVVFGRLVKVR